MQVEPAISVSIPINNSNQPIIRLHFVLLLTFEMRGF